MTPPGPGRATLVAIADESAARRKFWVDLGERAARSFLQAFALSWTTAVAALPDGAVPAWGPIAFAAAMAGLSGVMSLIARARGGTDSASSVDLDEVAAKARTKVIETTAVEAPPAAPVEPVPALPDVSPFAVDPQPPVPLEGDIDPDELLGH